VRSYSTGVIGRYEWTGQGEKLFSADDEKSVNSSLIE
jgi:hypothetical protein